ncbi:MAG: OmpA family protein [Flavobacteriales bacterium]
MEKHPGSMLKVYGFATQLGSEEANLELSKKRAEAVYAEISKCQKLDQSNSYVEWLGESLETYDLHYRDAHADYPCVDILVGR